MKALLSAMLAFVSCLAVSAFSFGEEEEPKKLEPHQVRDTVSLVLTRESAAKTPNERAAAVRDLSTLYLSLARDTEMAREPKLKLKAKMYSRLISIKQDLQNDLQRRKESGKYPVIIAMPSDADIATASTEQVESSSANIPSDTAAAKPKGGERCAIMVRHLLS